MRQKRGSAGAQDIGGLVASVIRCDHQHVAKKVDDCRPLRPKDGQVPFAERCVEAHHDGDWHRRIETQVDQRRRRVAIRRWHDVSPNDLRLLLQKASNEVEQVWSFVVEEPER